VASPTPSATLRYWNMARQRYCPGLARCWRALRVSADRAGNAARKPARKAGVLDHEDRVPRETDSPLEGAGFEPSVPREIETENLSQRPTNARVWVKLSWRFGFDRIAETVLSNEVLKLVSAIKSVKALVTRGHTWVSPENGPDPEPDLGGTYRPLG
jgi:hypothetical protein